MLSRGINHDGPLKLRIVKFSESHVVNYIKKRKQDYMLFHGINHDCSMKMCIAIFKESQQMNRIKYHKQSCILSTEI